MALYTQFQDPAQYYIQKDERRDENLRSAMALMMQLKQNEREWRRQNQMYELSERRTAAYEKSVDEQQRAEQKQWQARWEAIDRLYPPGSRENMALKAGMSLDQLETNNFPESTVSALTDYYKITRPEWENLSPTMKRSYFGQYWTAQNQETSRSLRAAEEQRANDLEAVKATLSLLRDQRSQREAQFKGQRVLGRDVGADQINNINDVIRRVTEMQESLFNGGSLGSEDRKRLYQWRDIESIMKDPYYFLSPELREEFKKREGIGKNNLAQPEGTIMPVTPTKRDASYAGVDVAKWVGDAAASEKAKAGAEVITLARANEEAAKAGLAEKDVVVEPIPGDPTMGLIVIGNAKYIVSLPRK
jgi:hypothetical protein